MICAIGLGLGGSPKILGRSSHTKDFIRKGESEAKIEIELLGDPEKKEPNVIIQRRLVGPSTEWRIDGVKADENRVHKVLRNLEIQVDNLVQFLPQDRVVEFAQFDGKQLLHETIRATRGTMELDTQKQLIELQRETSQAAVRVAQKRKQLDELKKMIERDHAIVEHQKNRQKMLIEIEWLKKKKLWVDFERIRDEAKKAKEDLKRLDETIRNGSTTLEPLKNMVRDSNTKFDKLKKEHEKAHSEYTKWSAQVEQSAQDINGDLEAISDLKGNLKDLEKKKVAAQENVVKQQVVVKKLEEQGKSKKGEEYFKAELKRVSESAKPLNDRRMDLESELAEASSERAKATRELKNIQTQESKANASSVGLSDEEKRELEKMRSSLIQSALRLPAESREKYLKLRREITGQSSQPKRFRGRIIGPLVCELRAADALVGKVLEYALRSNTWKFMTATDEHDHDLLLTDKVSAMLIQGTKEPPRHYSPETLAQLGIKGYLDQELLKCCDPLAVETARRLNQIHAVLVGTDQTDRLYERDREAFKRAITPRSEVNDKIVVITPTRRFEVFRSRYEKNQVIFHVVGLDAKLPMNLPLDETSKREQARKQAAEELAARRVELVNRKQQLEQTLVQLEDKITNLSVEKDGLTKKLAEIRDAKQRLMKEQGEEQQLENKLAIALDKLAKYEKEANQDWDRRASKLVADMTAARARLVEGGKEHAELVARCEAILTKLGSLALSKAQVDCERTKLGELLKQEEERVNNYAAERQRLQERSRSLLAAAHKAKEEASKACIVDDEVAAIFAELPDSLEELEERIVGHSAVVKNIHEDSNVLATYESNLAKRSILDEELSVEGSSMEDQRRFLKSQIESWKSRIKDMARRINDRFQYFFSEISKSGGYACAGEVALTLQKRALVATGAGDDEEDDEQEVDEDIASASMEIKVKFRQEQKLLPLDPSVHSGGERSITTFLYMLALQEMSAVPFRVVDEINQGMDPDKERLAFYRLGEVSSKARSQYFLATPKLLPGLLFPKDATILFVFNGPHNLTQKDWDIKRFLQARHEKRISTSMSSSSSSRLNKRQRVQEVAT